MVLEADKGVVVQHLGDSSENPRVGEWSLDLEVVVVMPRGPVGLPEEMLGKTSVQCLTAGLPHSIGAAEKNKGPHLPRNLKMFKTQDGVSLNVLKIVKYHHYCLFGSTVS